MNQINPLLAVGQASVREVRSDRDARHVYLLIIPDRVLPRHRRRIYSVGTRSPIPLGPCFTPAPGVFVAFRDLKWVRVAARLALDRSVQPRY